MKFNEKYKVSPGFEALFESTTDSEHIEQNAKNMSARFLSEIERLCDERKLLKKNLAKELGVSASYITQLFRGDKLLNFTFLSKLELYFKISFSIAAHPVQSLKVNRSNVLPLPDNTRSVSSAK